MGDDIFDGLSVYWRSGFSLGMRQRSRGVGKLPKDRGQGSQDNFEIQRKGYIARVKDIHLNHLTEGRLVFAVDLPKSGHAGQSVNPGALFRCVALEFADGAGSWSDETHFSLQHIEDLWQLVEARCS